MATHQLQNLRSSSYVIEHDVALEKQDAFREWQTNITKAASEYAGYQATDVCPPVEQDDKWYIMVHFDSPEHLNVWLDSDIRHKLVEIGKTIFSTSKITYYKTGLERWFIPHDSNPPAWKQIMATLLGLYPTVMILSWLQSFSGILKPFSPPDAMLISNFVSICLLTWIVMPLVARSLKFWLQPTPQTGAQMHWIGLGLVVFALILLRSLFAAIA
ncbi:MAG: hypothetical protein NW220_04685 [Leptolyngbyaceae cyanobacterium bins.349]|nr:hypothetical protein [Leptolyngbyaceae cyanobacterium bins.349]